MKRLVTVTANEDLPIMEDEYFKLVEDSGVGVQNTPWRGLRVISKGDAAKHVVEVRLNGAGMPRFEGDPVTYEYTNAYVSHGMRTVADSIEETREYADILYDAADFAEAVNEYLRDKSNFGAVGYQE